MDHQHGLRFGKDATALSSGALKAPANAAGGALEVWIQPNSRWDSGTVLAFYNPGHRPQFLLRQVQTDLELRVDIQHAPGGGQVRKLSVDDVFRRLPPSFIKAAPVFITITSGVRGARIYIDGVPASSKPQFPLSPEDYSGWFILGDSPRQPDNWKGRVYALAIYDRELDDTEVVRNYHAWKQKGSPELPAEKAEALYLFDEGKGNLVRDHSRSQINLLIPDRYQVIEKIALEPFWREFSMTRSYWGAALKNIVGFLPFGFCFYWYFLAARPAGRPMALTIISGFAVSLTIEVLQIFLPNRDSGTTDLITNTLGTWMGAASYAWLTPTLQRFSPRLASLFPPPSARHGS